MEKEDEGKAALAGEQQLHMGWRFPGSDVIPSSVPTGLALKGKGTWRAEMVGSVEEFEHFTDFSLNTSTKPIQSREP